jgi:membrane-associated phospholipid phosphatase
VDVMLQYSLSVATRGIQTYEGVRMTVAYVSWVLGVLIVAGAGLLVYVTTPTKAAWFQNLIGRLGRIRDAAVDELGRYGGAVVVLLAGAAAAVIISWPFGRFARRYKPNIDAPFLRWTRKHVSNHGSWHHINSVLTNMGNRPVIKILVPVGAVVLAALWARRGFWIPILVVPLGYVFEKFGQSALSKVVARQPTPTLPDFGTYPSGGCARLIVVYGLIWYMVTITFPAMGRFWKVAGFTVVAILAFVEGYTRIYLIKHWGLDVVGGWLFGTLLLLALIGAASCFKPRAVRESADAS